MMKKIIYIFIGIICLFSFNNYVNAGSCDFNGAFGYNDNKDDFVYLLGGNITYDDSTKDITGVQFNGGMSAIISDGNGAVPTGIQYDSRPGKKLNVNTKFAVYDSVHIYVKTNDGGKWLVYDNHNVFFESASDFSNFNDKFKKYIQDKNTCPKLNYHFVSKSTGTLNETLDNLNLTKNTSTIIYKRKLQLEIDGTSADSSSVSIDDVNGEISDYDVNNVDKDTQWGEPEEFKYQLDIKKNDTSIDCASLVGEELGDMLHTVVNVIKIVVALLLIVLGVMDFVGAIIAQDEGGIKKAQSKFVKRLLYAVLFFIAPTVIRLLLTVSHEIWPNISTDLCGIL